SRMPQTAAGRPLGLLPLPDVILTELCQVRYATRQCALELRPGHGEVESRFEPPAVVVLPVQEQHRDLFTVQIVGVVVLWVEAVKIDALVNKQLLKGGEKPCGHDRIALLFPQGQEDERMPLIAFLKVGIVEGVWRGEMVADDEEEQEEGTVLRF